MKIFLTMTETAKALAYSPDYFQNNWRSICRNLQAPFPVNHHRRGEKRWRQADLERYAAGALFEPPEQAKPQRPAIDTVKQATEPDWDTRFRERARKLLRN